MGFLDLAKKRRSCRSYLDQPVPRDKIERCLEAARLAPSACNSQPWYFIVVDNRPLKEKLAEAAFSGMYSIFSFARQAPVLVCLIRERSSYVAALGGAFRGGQYSLIDIGIVGEHFVLQAAEEGLATCWIGWFDEKAAKKILGIPPSKKIDVIFTLGHSAENPIREKKRKGLGEMREYR